MEKDEVASGPGMSWGQKWALIKKNLGDNANSAWGKISQFTQANKKKLGTAALVGAAGFIAYKVYKNYFSKAAKACAGKSGEEKAACMAKAKQGAAKARMATMNKAKSMAGNGVNPAQARAAISNKIASMKG